MKVIVTAFLVAMGALCLAAVQGVAQTVNYETFPGVEREITDVSGYHTTGEDMGGMRVTAHFTSDLTTTVETVFWNPGALGSEAGSAVGTDWRLDQVGDTWDSRWELTGTGPNLALYALTLEGFLPSDDPVGVRATVFDRTDPFFGTDGSYRGRDLFPVGYRGTWDHVRVQYIDEVDSLAHPGPNPVGDLYRVMRLVFGTVEENEPLPIFIPVPFGGDDDFLFLQDTDTVGERIPNGDPGDEGTPEPAGFALAAMAALLVGGASRRPGRGRC